MSCLPAWVGPDLLLFPGFAGTERHLEQPLLALRREEPMLRLLAEEGGHPSHSPPHVRVEFRFRDPGVDVDPTPAEEGLADGGDRLGRDRGELVRRGPTKPQEVGGLLDHLAPILGDGDAPGPPPLLQLLDLAPEELVVSNVGHLETGDPGSELRLVAGGRIRRRRRRSLRAAAARMRHHRRHETQRHPRRRDEPHPLGPRHGTLCPSPGRCPMVPLWPGSGAIHTRTRAICRGSVSDGDAPHQPLGTFPIFTVPMWFVRSASRTGSLQAKPRFWRSVSRSSGLPVRNSHPGPTPNRFAYSASTSGESLSGSSVNE